MPNICAVLVLMVSMVSCSTMLPSTDTPNIPHTTTPTSGSNGRVRVDVYYETLCPDSMNFLRFRLIPDYPLLESLIDLHLYPFGKAEIVEYDNNFDFYCQHGSKECRGNMFQACAIAHANRNWSRILPFINCMEKNFYGRNPNIDQITNECADAHNFSFKELLSCVTSAQGRRLMYDAGKKTKALRPRLNFVPTVVFHDNYSDQNKWAALSTNFTELLCSNYEPMNKPKLCL